MAGRQAERRCRPQRLLGSQRPRPRGRRRGSYFRRQRRGCRHFQDGDVSGLQHLQQAELGGCGLPYSVPDVPWRKPVHPDGKWEVTAAARLPVCSARRLRVPVSSLCSAALRKVIGSCSPLTGALCYLKTKEKYGKECKICARPFTVFRWCPGVRMRFKKTEVCQTCSKLKNVCQTCLLDLEYGLPIQVRDAGLSFKDDMPKSDVNKEYYTQNVEREISNSDGTRPVGVLGKATATSDMLLKLARTTPYYKRNRPHICSFWVKGECKRGEECPYRHEKPTDPDDPLADQNIKDRYYGINDPVADKLLKRASTMPRLDPPDDKTITTLYVGGLGDTISETDLRNHFYQFGEIRTITVVQRQQCAFIQFATRQAAEMAAEKSFNKLIVNGRRLNVKWGRSQAARGKEKDKEGTTDSGIKLEPVPGLPGALPPPPAAEEEASANYFNLPPSGPPAVVNIALPPPPGIAPPPPPGFGPHMFHPMGPPPPFMRAPGPIHYPSQDPQRMGAHAGKHSSP